MFETWMGYTEEEIREMSPQQMGQLVTKATGVRVSDKPLNKKLRAKNNPSKKGYIKYRGI